MPAAAPMPRTAQRVAVFLCLVWGLFALFAHLDDPQLEFFDEARRANNALEMAGGDAPSLLTPSYYGKPDHWGTKPPLLVWLQAGWMKILGPGELAVRLPSALATVGLLLLLIWWGRRDWGSPLAGALGGVTVLCNWEFMGNHGARTGDYDALLVLFLTAQLVFFYRWATDGGWRWLLLTGAAVFLAGMTKGVAGGFLLPGLALWLLLDQRGRGRILTPGPYLVIGAAIGLVVGYYFLRETVDPGFLDMLRQNELGGRFAKSNEGHRGPWWYYFHRLWTDPAWVYLLPFLPVGLAVLLADDRYRRPALLLTITAVVFLAVITQAATKLYWYKSPVLPLLGMLIGAGLYHAGLRVLTSFRNKLGPALMIITLLGVYTVPASLISYRSLHPRRYQETTQARAAFREFMRRGDVEPPYSVLIGDYHPNARFYVERLRTQGKDVTLKRYKRLRPFLSLDIQPKDVFRVGERVVVCASGTWEHLFDRYRMKVITADQRCKLVELKAERDDR